MSARVINEISNCLGQKMITRKEILKKREQVKAVMWKYYSENKFNLNEDIGEFREEIIVELMKGMDVEEVFEFFGGRKLLKAG